MVDAEERMKVFLLRQTITGEELVTACGSVVEGWDKESLQA